MNTQPATTRGPSMRDVRQIVTLLRRANPRRIILFGSLVRRRVRADSDIDLCVLVDDQDQRPSFRIKQELFRLLMAAEYRFVADLDFQIYKMSDFARRLADGDPMVTEIARGKVVYSRD